jgi:hypothetical protein
MLFKWYMEAASYVCMSCKNIVPGVLKSYRQNPLLPNMDCFYMSGVSSDIPAHQVYCTDSFHSLIFCWWLVISWQRHSVSGALVFGMFTKFWKATINFIMCVHPSIHPSIHPSVCLSVHLHGTTDLLLDGFSWNLIFVDFWKVCRENSNLLESDYNDGYFTWRPMLHVWWCLTDLFLEWEIFQTKVVEKIKTHILHSMTFFFLKIVLLMR